MRSIYSISSKAANPASRPFLFLFESDHGGGSQWLLRRDGLDATAATRTLNGLNAAKNELLLQRGINFNLLPNWQKRGIGLYWEDVEREARDPRTGAAVRVQRRPLKTDLELPMRDEYSQFVLNFVRPDDV